MGKLRTLLAGMVAAVMMFTLAGCGDTSGKGDGASEKVSKTTTTVTTLETTTTTKATTTKATTTAPKTTTKKVTTTKAIPRPETIGSRTTQFYEDNNRHAFFWSFYDENNNSITVDADITIIITNDNGEEVYNNKFSVTENDYSMWTNTFNPDGFLQGCVYVPLDDITPGTCKEGTYKLIAETQDGLIFEYDENTGDIFHLPMKTANIILPNCPVVVCNYNWKDELKRKVEVSKIEYEFDDDDLILTVTASLIYNIDGYDSSSATIGYKLKSSKGIVVETGDIYLESMVVGETTIDETRIYDMDLSEEYTLELWDTD